VVDIWCASGGDVMVRGRAGREGTRLRGMGQEGAMSSVELPFTSSLEGS
jgi:hypothetical protein